MLGTGNAVFSKTDRISHITVVIMGDAQQTNKEIMSPNAKCCGENNAEQCGTE